MPVGVGPLETIVNVSWATSGFYVLLNFTQMDITEDTVKVSPQPNGRVAFDWRKVTKEKIPPPGTTKRFYVWLGVSTDYMWATAETPPVIMVSGYRGATSLANALDGINVNGFEEAGLYTEFDTEAEARDYQTTMTDQTAAEWDAFQSAYAGTYTRWVYNYEEQVVTNPPLNPTITVQSIFLVRVGALSEDEKDLLSSVTTVDATLDIYVYPAPKYVPYPQDTSGPNGEPLFPIRQMDDLEHVPAELWRFRNSRSQPFPSKLPPGTHMVSGVDKLYQTDLDEKLVQLYSNDFYYDVVGWPPEWQNIIGPPPMLPVPT